MAANDQGQLIPSAGLEQLKYQVASALPHLDATNAHTYNESLEDLKIDVAREVGVPLKPGYNGDLTSREAGIIGGHMGGKIGGQMVRRMLSMAEQLLKD